MKDWIEIWFFKTEANVGEETECPDEVEEEHDEGGPATEGAVVVY